MNNLFKIDNIVSLASEKEEVPDFNSIKNEGFSIIQKFKEKTKESSEWKSLSSRLEKAMLSKNKEVSKKAQQVYISLANTIPTASEEDDEFDINSPMAAINQDHPAYAIISNLNKACRDVIKDITHDLIKNDKNKYKNCIDSFARTWAESAVSPNIEHTQVYMDSLNSMSAEKEFFFVEDFFSANPPVILQYYAYNPGRLSEIDSFLHKTYNNYAEKGSIHQGLSYKEIRRRMSGRSTAVPWHWQTYIAEDGKSHLIAEKLALDFTELIRNKDHQAMCVLLGRAWNISNRFVRMKIKENIQEQKSGNEEKSDSGAKDFADNKNISREDFSRSVGTAAKSGITHERKIFKVVNKGVFVTDKLMSSASDSLAGKFKEYVEKVKSGFNEIISATSQEASANMHRIWMTLYDDFQDASQQMESKIRQWQYIYNYEESMRSKSHEREYLATNMDIIMNRAQSHRANKDESTLRFVANGSRGIVSLTIDLQANPADQHSTQHGYSIGRIGSAKAWQVKDILISSVKWSYLEKMGLYLDPARASFVNSQVLSEDAVAGQNFVKVISANKFAKDSKVIIMAVRSPSNSSENEANVEKDLYIEAIEGNKIFLKRPLKYNWNTNRGSFIQIDSKSNDINVTPHISEILDQQHEQTAAKNMQDTKEAIGEGLFVLNADYALSQSESGDIDLYAELVRSELAENIYLILEASKLVGGESAKTSKAWKNNNIEYFKKYIGVVKSFSDYIKKLVYYYQKKYDVSDEALQCFETIGWGAFEAKRRDLQQQNINGSKVREITEIENARDLFRALYAAVPYSDYKESLDPESYAKDKERAFKAPKWIDKATAFLDDPAKELNQNRKTMSKFLLDIHPRLYEHIKKNAYKIVLKELEKMSSYEVIDLGLMSAKASGSISKDSACSAFRRDLFEKKESYKKLQSPTTDFVLSQLFKECANTNKEKTASCENCFKKQEANHGKHIDEWMRYMAREVYIGQ